MKRAKSKYFILYVIFIILFLSHTSNVKAFTTKSTTTIILPEGLRYGTSKNCSVGDTLKISYLVRTGLGVDAYLCNSGNGSEFLIGNPFTYIKSAIDSVQVNWSYTATENRYYGIYFHNNNPVEVTITIIITHIRASDVTGIPFGLYYLPFIAISIISLVFIINRRKSIIKK